MIKSQLISKIFEKQQRFSLDDVKLGVNTILKLMSDTLSQGDRIEIRGFGSFVSRHVGSRNAHNPKTGERFQAPAKKMTRFKSGRDLRARINESR